MPASALAAMANRLPGRPFQHQAIIDRYLTPAGQRPYIHQAPSVCQNCIRMTRVINIFKNNIIRACRIIAVDPDHGPFVPYRQQGAKA
ncbi:MAG: hypothetical protein JWQ79_1996 [Mucilaginibacter sp.]|nr:hypothetical protein [Mucilaginibacter sp.]